MVSRKLQQEIAGPGERCRVGGVGVHDIPSARGHLWYVRQNCQLSTLVFILLRQSSPICLLLERECSQYMLFGWTEWYVCYVSAQAVVADMSEPRSVFT